MVDAKLTVAVVYPSPPVDSVTPVTVPAVETNAVPAAPVLVNWGRISILSCIVLLKRALWFSFVGSKNGLTLETKLQ